MMEQVGLGAMQQLKPGREDMFGYTKKMDNGSTFHIEMTMVTAFAFMSMMSSKLAVATTRRQSTSSIE
jgi:hypothetical protein